MAQLIKNSFALLILTILTPTQCSLRGPVQNVLFLSQNVIFLSHMSQNGAIFDLQKVLFLSQNVHFSVTNVNFQLTPLATYEQTQAMLSRAKLFYMDCGKWKIVDQDFQFLWSSVRKNGC
jgi:hypothetical protein